MVIFEVELKTLQLCLKVHKLAEALVAAAFGVLGLVILRALFALNAELGRGANFEALGADILAAVEALAVSAVLDAEESFLDLLEVEALTVSEAHLHALLNVVGSGVHFVEELIFIHREIHAKGLAVLEDLFALLLEHYLKALDHVAVK